MDDINSLVSTGRHCLPSGETLELHVVCRPLEGYLSQNAIAVGLMRDVYLCERGTTEGAGATSAFLMNTKCPLPTVKRICLWCEVMRIPIIQEPPGNLDPDFHWPDSSEPTAPQKLTKKTEIKPNSALSFE